MRMAPRKRKSRMTPNQFPRECLFCSKVYQGSGALEVHMNQHTGEHPYECTECPSIFTDHRYLGLHMDQVHIGKKFICGGCHQEYYSQGTLNRHRNRGYCSGIKKIKKISKVSKKIHGKLGKVTRKAGKDQGDRHLKLSGDTKKMTSKTVKIDKVDESIDKSSGQGTIKKGRKSGSEKEVPRKLGENDGDNYGESSSAKTKRISSNTNLQSLKSGIILKTEKSVTSRPCGSGKLKMEKKPVIEKAVTGNPNPAKRPSRIKTEELIDQKPVVAKSAVYKCSQCQTTHLDRNLLLKHAADCHELKIFECPICKNLYTQYQNMTRHLKTAHGDEDDFPEVTKWRERRTKCSLCGMTFESFPLLLEHKKIEHDLKLFKCTYCSNEYTQYSNMARHRKSHGDDNPDIGDGMQQTAPVTRARIYTTTKETVAKKEQTECTRISNKASEQQDAKLDHFPVFVNGEENGLFKNSLQDQAHQQLLQMVAQLRLQKEQNDKDASFFLHLNRYDPSSI